MSMLTPLPEAFFEAEAAYRRQRIGGGLRHAPGRRRFQVPRRRNRQSAPQPVGHQPAVG